MRRVLVVPVLLALAVACGRDEPEPAGPGDESFELLEAQRTIARSFAAGRYPEAAAAAERALAIREKSLGTDHPETARSLNNLATILQRMGEFGRAEALHLRALAILETLRGPEHPETGGSLLNLGLLYQAMGDFARAEPIAQRAVTILERTRPRHRDTATALSSLAAIYEHAGDFPRALPLETRALAIRQDLFGPTHPETAKSLRDLGLVSYSLGDVEQARRLFGRALAISEERLGPEHPSTAVALGNLARTLETSGELEQAERLYARALAIREKVLGPDHPETALGLQHLAFVHQSRGRFGQAELLQRRALAIARDNVERASRSQSERQQLVMMAQMRDYLDAWLSVAQRTSVTGELAFDAVLQWKGMVTARQEALHELRAALRARGDEPALRAFADLEATTRRLASLALAPSEALVQSERRRELEALTQEKERLEQGLAGLAGGADDRGATARRTNQDIRRALPEGAILVDLLEYTHSTPDGKGTFHRERRLLAFVVRPDQVVRVELGAADPIRAAVETWRSTHGDGEAGVAAGKALRAAVWEPIAPLLGDVRLVLVSPDGPLTGFPFAALPADPPSTHLVEEFTFVTLPVPLRLPDLRGNAPRRGAPSLLAVGDVAFDLPGVWTSIRAIGALFAQRFPGAPATVLRGTDAVEEVVRLQAPGHRYLHLAVHGYFAPPELRSALQFASLGGAGLFQRTDVAGWNPGLLSGLVLADAHPLQRRGPDDGILTALEVATLDLSDVELAVLSACETGLGASAGGEGLLGLQRAFAAAGAGSVVASLWAVPDAATAGLMEEFYANLWTRGVSRAEALRAAQVSLLREGKATLPDAPATTAGRLPPFYWAAFVLSGRWEDATPPP